MDQMRSAPARLPSADLSPRRAAILDAALPVFGRYGYRKTSVDDLATAAGLSKQGLYLHFTGKEQIFLEALRKYLDDGLALARNALGQKGTPLAARLLAALDAWFGRHLTLFAPASFDVIEAGNLLSGAAIEQYKTAFQDLLAQELATAPEFRKSRNICTPAEVAQALFVCGLSWKEAHTTRSVFVTRMRLCIRACCQLVEPREKI